MSRYTNTNGSLNEGRVLKDVIMAIIFLVVLGLGGCPYYSVWQQGLSGKAALARATQDRQIAIQEAQAKMESASMLASAEIERAKGVAEANRIIGDSLHNNENYLRYLFVNSLENTRNQVIYVPTESNLPILEASRLSPKP
jgi:predicted aminopeptidase